MGCRRLDRDEDWVWHARAKMYVPAPRRLIRPQFTPVVWPRIYEPPQMALAARTVNGSAGNDETGISGNLVVSFGSAVASTDIVALFVGTNNGGTISTTYAAPAGWTAILAAASTTVGATCAWLAGWLAYGNVANKTFTRTAGSGGEGRGWVTQAFTGGDQSTNLDAAGATVTNTAANSIVAASYNTVTTGAIPIIGAVNWNTGATFSATGYTLVLNVASPANIKVGLLYANSAISPAGATGAVTVNDSAAAASNLLVIMPGSIRPDAAVAPPQFMPYILR
jgi:hypothetical protein